MRRARLVLACLVVAGAGACGDAGTMTVGFAGSTGTTAATATPTPFPSLPTIAQCRAAAEKKACYSADLLRTAYGIDALAKQGLTGRGRTIAVFDFSGSPTLAADLATFSRQMGLPAPRLRIRQERLSTAPPASFDPKDPGDAGTAMETTLDLQAAHAMAPDASLILEQIDLPAPSSPAPSPTTSAAPVLTPVQAQATARVIAAGVEDIVANTSADVISISYGIDDALIGGALAQELQPALAKATAAGVTVLAATGDSGAAQPAGPDGALTRTTNWPASSPTVTAVGGTTLHLDQNGVRTSPDTVWNDPAGQWKGGKGATGGGVSRVFPRPVFQDAVKAVTGSGRGIPDLSMSADPDGGMLVYQSYSGTPGWIVVGGTSEATPLLAGVVALAVQKAGDRLGDLNPAIYRLAGHAQAGVVDVTSGTNGPDGYPAGPGYDLASGWGTIDAAAFVPSLAARP